MEQQSYRPLVENENVYMPPILNPVDNTPIANTRAVQQGYPGSTYVPIQADVAIQASILPPEQVQRNILFYQLQTIDNRLKQKEYLCYKCWMWIMLIPIILNFVLNLVKGIFDRVLLFKCIIFIAATRLMILAFRDKRLTNATSAKRLFILAIALQVILEALGISEIAAASRSKEQIFSLIIITVILNLMRFGPLLFGAIKVRDLLKEREDIKQKAKLFVSTANNA